MLFYSPDNNTFTAPPGQTVYTYKYSSETRENTKYGQPNGYSKPAVHLQEQQLPLRHSPFPRDEGDSAPGLQNPPKRLDDLMASFGDRTDYSTSYHANKEYRTNVSDYQSKSREYDYNSSGNNTAEYTIPIKRPQQPAENPHAPADIKVADKQTEIKETEVTQSVAGPAVFYPPGSTTFVKKEDIMHQVHTLPQLGLKIRLR